MVRSTRTPRRLSSRKLRFSPYPNPSSCQWKSSEEEVGLKKTSVSMERKDWEDVTCSVCMEYPHNAVLLLCSSHDKGCRPYMCGTSYRHSNCLDQFKKANTKMLPSHLDAPTDAENLGLGLISATPMACEKSEAMELACPLCRGLVKGWTVVNPAREYLNSKKRSCMQESCSFVGTYKELSKHVRSEHLSAKPREVDPEHEHKWRMLEHERERQDVISTIRSSMPRSVVFGDYVIEMSNSDTNTDDEEDELGDGHADLDLQNRGISRSILYFFLRESARLMRLHRENNSAVSNFRIVGGAPSNDDGDDDDGDDIAAAPIISGGGDTGGIGINLRSERRHRRRRRSRGRPGTLAEGSGQQATEVRPQIEGPTSSVFI